MIVEPMEVLQVRIFVSWSTVFLPEKLMLLVLKTTPSRIYKLVLLLVLFIHMQLQLLSLCINMQFLVKVKPSIPLLNLSIMAILLMIDQSK